MTFAEKTKNAIAAVASSLFWAYAVAKLKLAALYISGAIAGYIARHVFTKEKVAMKKDIQLGSIGTLSVKSENGEASLSLSISANAGGGAAAGVAKARATVELDLEESQAADLGIAVLEAKFAAHPAIVAALEGLKGELHSVLGAAPAAAPVS